MPLDSPGPQYESFKAPTRVNELSIRSVIARCRHSCMIPHCWPRRTQHGSARSPSRQAHEGNGADFTLAPAARMAAISSADTSGGWAGAGLGHVARCN